MPKITRIVKTVAEKSLKKFQKNPPSPKKEKI